LKTREAEIKRVEALLRQAQNEEKRADQLREKHPDFISDTELDQIVSNRESLEAQLAVAHASVEQAMASLENAETNLAYTDITSPVDGLVIDRLIDPGQTLAAQFQTPRLFVVAPNMREKMHVFASVDEADIGLIRDAQLRDAVVEFTVDAYPDDLFKGKIAQVRLNPTSMQNVVTYPVIVEAANPELKLLPGMTANLSFQVEHRDDVVKIPNAALRFFPKKEQVRAEDHKLLEGGVDDEEQQKEDDLEARSAAEKAEAKRKRNKRHVWVVDGELLKAIEIVTGISDSRFSELVSGELKKGVKLVTGTTKKPTDK
jgi:HlyD family secretion protein